MGIRQLRRRLTSANDERIAPDCQLHVLNTLFFRNKGAYIVGRLINHGTVHPFAIALLRTPSGHITADALLHTSDDLSTLFSLRVPIFCGYGITRALRSF